MVERLRSNRPQACSRDAFYDLVVRMNATGNTVAVPKQALEDVCTCHQRATNESPAKAMPSLLAKGRKFYSVDRLELFAFVNKHGKVCPVP